MDEKQELVDVYPPNKDDPSSTMEPYTDEISAAFLIDRPDPNNIQLKQITPQDRSRALQLFFFLRNLATSKTSSENI